MSKRTSQVTDEGAEVRWQLICQDQNFCRALTAAIKHGKETAAGVTATVRIGKVQTGPMRTRMQTGTMRTRRREVLGSPEEWVLENLFAHREKHRRLGVKSKLQ
jgi:hypothetical protein